MPRFKILLLALAALALAACGIPTEPEDFEFGRVDVYVRDTDGQAVNGVPVRLDRRTGQVEETGGTTGTVGLAGYYFFLKTAGDYRVVITVPNGYALAANQSASADVSFVKDQTKTVNFVLRRL
jgi:hypothetical protein